MTVDEYIAAQPEDIRELLTCVRAVIADAIPDAQEWFSYQMPTFRRGHDLIHFAAMKNHLGIYPGPEAVAAFERELEERKLKHSKGAIRFPYGKVDIELIRRIAEWCGRIPG